MRARDDGLGAGRARRGLRRGAHAPGRAQTPRIFSQETESLSLSLSRYCIYLLAPPGVSQVSHCALLSDADVAQIAKHCPSLTSVSLADSRQTGHALASDRQGFAIWNDSR